MASQVYKIKLQMKKWLESGQGLKQTIECQAGKQGKQNQTKNHWTTLSIENQHRNQATRRPLGVSTTRMTLTSSLKRSSIYRKIMNHSISAHHHSPNITTLEDECAKNSFFERFPKQRKEKTKEFYYVIENEDQASLTTGEVGKIKSFESFLENKKKQNQKVNQVQLKRTKISTNMQIANPVNEKSRTNKLKLNLQGMGIRRLKDFNEKEKMKPNPENLQTPHHNSLNDEPLSKDTPSRLRSIQSQWYRSQQIPNHPYLKYIFNQDEGYCLFNKMLNPISAKKSVHNRKKLIYIDLRKELTRHRHSKKCERLKPVVNNIEGWIVNTEEQQQGPTSAKPL